ncbi:2-hydroxychromene-2-carboxylate isomerase [Ramlibacter montanisoli]|uniref:2-hydroxychromene-2-carboxylate isomerase n=1 Tax=Ramlibacter montanisoli TaxID=2732512 RepID=A0A849K224_9BURK|nr:2-hydroxychromene-2-carboxylate isomerase [Ramlibacter montanisoli]NNU42542.1 2-hydroxychromene-2-carboxylate isomerase [Ramlibacter montanisoli]
MAAPLAFYFDFISPYGYFASRRIEALAAHHGRTVDWRPMLLGVAVLKVMGLKPLLDTPLKGDYVRRDVLRLARRAGVRLGRDLNASVGNPLPPARAFYWVKQHHPRLAAPMAHALFHAFWAEGRDLSTPEAVGAIRLPEGLDAAAVIAGAASDEAATLLRNAVAASIKAGIFGSPTIVVDGEPFWGNDRLADVDAWLAEGGW